MFSSLSQITQVVSVGSVDGICTAAALLRLIGRPTEIGLVFAQAFTIDRIDPTKWTAGSKVAFVDLAVNNRDKAMTAAFVRRIREAGHEIVAVIDEHSREDWLEILGSFDGLIVAPQSQSEGTFKSSGAVLKAAVGPEADDHTVELLDAADAGDRMDFSTHFGGIVNQSVKSDIANDSRRVHLAQHFAENIEADDTIRGWMAEYEEILANHQEIIVAKTDLGNGIVRVVATGKKVDMTTLMSTLYRGGAKVVVLQGEAFNKSLGRKTIQVAYGTNEKSLDLLSVVKTVVPTASGFAQKVNVDPEHEAAATAAIRIILAA